MTESAEKASAVWTYSATQTLLKLYENELGMLESPKKKTRIWLVISEHLKVNNIEVTADQVRWKINALTKKYKQCVNTGQPRKFKYLKEMDDIYAKYNLDCDPFECIGNRKDYEHIGTNNVPIQINSDSNKVMIELRKARLASRIESDITQNKLYLEKQWLEYLKRQEQDRIWQDGFYERNLNLKEKELKLRRHDLEIKESLELQKLQLKETGQDELFRLEKEKCKILKQFLDREDIDVNLILQ